ncbi:hypothetical protein [Ensifer sp.]|uniref:hypothetical protein n=1 Tax=Ensifer sp. TaxID=1872086 RepID=UPI002E109C5D|nr:hypothetical protein [Ensifer sp.]
MTDTDYNLQAWHFPAPLSSVEECRWAREVAAHAHAGQRDKAGEPYFNHCQRVADAVVGEKAKSVAFLHDVVEQSAGWSENRLREVGFSAEVVTAIELLTLRPGDTKDMLVIRAASNPLSLVVKRADLNDNLAQLKSAGKSGDEYLRWLNLLAEASSVLPSASPKATSRSPEGGKKLSRPPQADVQGTRDFTAVDGPRMSGAARVVLTILWILFAGACATGVWILVS